MAGKPYRWIWTDHKTQTLIALHEHGYSTALIGKRIGFPKGIVRLKIRALGLPGRFPTFRLIIDKAPYKNRGPIRPKLKREDATAIRRDRAKGEKINILAFRFGVSASLISRIVNGHRWPDAAA